MVLEEMEEGRGLRDISEQASEGTHYEQKCFLMMSTHLIVDSD